MFVVRNIPTTGQVGRFYGVLLIAVKKRALSDAVDSSRRIEGRAFRGIEDCLTTALPYTNEA
jgi:hypothetical protein